MANLLEPAAAYSTTPGAQLLGTLEPVMTPENGGYYQLGNLAVDASAGVVYGVSYSNSGGYVIDAYRTDASFALVDSFRPPTSGAIDVDPVAKKLYIAD